ncbi:MAG: response regulator [Bdellovibrionales bacterium]|nr:response regulator [Bdellovibrionales bacterium]
MAEFDSSLRCLAMNPAWRELQPSATPPPAIEGATIRELFDDELSSVLEPCLEQVTNWGRPVRMDCPIRFPRGIRLFDMLIFPLWGADGRVERACLQARDVTEARAQQRLVESKLKDFSEVSSDLLWEWDAEGKIVSLNAVSESGYSLEEIREKPFWEMLSAQEAERVKKWWQRLMRNPKPFRDFELERRLPDGTLRWYRMSGIPLFDEIAGLCGFRGTATDITQRKREQEDLIEAREAALASSDFKSRFLANMSHEIRTPMNAVVGLASLLLDTPLNDEQREQVETIQRSADSLLMLINDILDLSKVEAGKLELERLDFNLGELVQGTMEMFARAAAAKGIRLVCEIAPGYSGMRHGDPGRIRQILVNLVSNALKFSRQGCVTLRVGPPAVGGIGARAHFEVADEGVGIPKGVAAKLFRSFTQGDSSTTRKYGGTGLGLSISKHLVSLMGGEIGVESEEGSGSKFWFSIPLPVRGPAVAAPSAPRAVRPPAQPRAERILVVEDNAVNQKVVLRMLERLGFRADAVGDGREAVRAVAGLPYDLVFMDCQMPEMDGYEAARAIRAAETVSGALPVPIVALTAHAMKGDAERSVEAGMNDHLVKPLDLDKLERSVARWLPDAKLRPERPEPAVAETTAEARAGVLDEKVLAGLRELDGADGGKLLQELVEMFITASPQRITALEQAAAAGDARGVEKAAHDLKSSSGILGARRLMELCACLEVLAAGGAPALELARGARELREDYEKIAGALSGLRAA